MYLGRVLIVAGSDSGGGAGLQADLKTVLALGGYATIAVTALTAQDTMGVQAVEPVAAAFVQAQMRLALADIGADAVKIGMLGSEAVASAVAETLDEGPPLPVVLDPVMVAKGGAALMDESAFAVLTGRLIPRAALLTPNLPEAERLLGQTIATPQDMVAAAETLAARGTPVLLKGGHLEGALVHDVLAGAGLTRVWTDTRIATRSTHGTGCTLASAIAVGLAQGLALEGAIDRARRYLRRALETAPGLGAGHGPLGHGHTVTPFA